MTTKGTGRRLYRVLAASPMQIPARSRNQCPSIEQVLVGIEIVDTQPDGDQDEEGKQRCEQPELDALQPVRRDAAIGLRILRGGRRTSPIGFQQGPSNSIGRILGNATP